MSSTTTNNNLNTNDEDNSILPYHFDTHPVYATHTVTNHSHGFSTSDTTSISTSSPITSGWSTTTTAAATDPSSSFSPSSSNTKASSPPHSLTVAEWAGTKKRSNNSKSLIPLLLSFPDILVYIYTYKGGY